MKTNLSHFTDVHMRVQKLRVATGNRLAHLKKRDRKDDRAEHIYKLAKDFEETLEGYIAEEFQGHPTYPWTFQQKGCGLEAAAKVIGIIEGVTFSNALLGDLKSVGIQTMEELKENWDELEKQWSEMFERRSSIRAFDNPSKLRRFAGLAPVDGKAEKVTKGQKGIHYNPELRSMLWRLLIRLLQQRGVWLRKYEENVEYYTKRCERQGIKVMPTPLGRYCLTCQELKSVPKTTKNCLECGEELVGKTEPPGVLYLGHLVNMAKRKTIRLWLDLLWVVWREALGLPIRTPYAVEYLGHHPINPWEMVDKGQASS